MIERYQSHKANSFWLIWTASLSISGYGTWNQLFPWSPCNMDIMDTVSDILCIALVTSSTFTVHLLWQLNNYNHIMLIYTLRHLLIWFNCNNKYVAYVERISIIISAPTLWCNTSPVHGQSPNPNSNCHISWILNIKSNALHITRLN